MPPLTLQPEAQKVLSEYRWPGNIRQLKNLAEQMSILEKNHTISADTLLKYLPPAPLNNLPILMKGDGKTQNEFSERDLLYKVLFDMKKDLNDLKFVVNDMMQHSSSDPEWRERSAQLMDKLQPNIPNLIQTSDPNITIQPKAEAEPIQQHEEVEESLSLNEIEKEYIKKALLKYKGKKKPAAKELGISERTLFRKMQDYNIR